MAQKAKSVGKLHAVFLNRLRELEQNALEIANSALHSNNIRPWQVPKALQQTDLHDIPKLHTTAFDREEANVNYQQTLQNAATPGTVGDAIGLKTQIAYNATEERAFRARHASVCRSLIHMHGRRAGHGESGVFTAVRNQVENTIKAGAVTQ